MHIQPNNTTVWHSYAKVKAKVCYGIITKRVNGVIVLTLKNIYATRKEAKKAVNIECQRLSKGANDAKI